MSGPTQAIRDEVWRRDKGKCRRCGRQIGQLTIHSIHHRLGRQMGGSRHTPGINDPANLALVCGSGTTGCHGFIESHRTLAYRMGYLVHRGQNPADVPWLPIEEEEDDG